MRNILLACLLGVVSCNQYRSTENQLDIVKENYKKLKSVVQGNFDEVDLKDKMSAVSLGGARNIGEFFDRRLIFYKIDYPSIQIGRSAVEEIVFYFMDSALVKLRYKVKSNVSDYLLDSLGLSTFKPLDEYSKKQIDEDNIVRRYGGTMSLTKGLKTMS